MKPTLNLLIDDEWPAQRPECFWWLSDEHDREIARGYSGPLEWPKPNSDTPLDCRIALSGTVLACHYCQLPSKTQTHSQALIAVALEDELLQPAEALLFSPAPGAVSAESRHAVASVLKARLVAVRHYIGELGLNLRAAWPLAFLVAPGSAIVIDHETTLRLPDGGFIQTSESDTETWLVTLNLPRDMPRWIADREQSANWMAEKLYWPTGSGFLQGDLAPKPSTPVWRAALRPLARLGLGSGIAIFLLCSAQTFWLGWQANTLRAAIEDHFHRIEPQAALVDPIRQASRRVDAAKRAMGDLVATDYLSLLSVMTESNTSAYVRGMTYESNTLRIKANLNAEQHSALVQAARGRQLHLEMTDQEIILSAGVRP